MSPRVRTTVIATLAVCGTVAFGLAGSGVADSPSVSALAASRRRQAAQYRLHPCRRSPVRRTRIHGESIVKTPNIDAIAHRGVHLRNAFVTTSLCSPSRATILTGLYAHQHHVVDNKAPIPPGTVFFPQYLQKAGYQTALIGKWHMGEDSGGPQPGFDHWVSFKGQGSDQHRQRGVARIDGPLQVAGGELEVVIRLGGGGHGCTHLSDGQALPVPTTPFQSHGRAITVPPAAPPTPVPAAPERPPVAVPVPATPPAPVPALPPLPALPPDPLAAPGAPAAPGWPALELPPSFPPLLPPLPCCAPPIPALPLPSCPAPPEAPHRDAAPASTALATINRNAPA